MYNIKHLKRNITIAIIFCSVLFTACTGYKKSHQALLHDKSYCNKQQLIAYTAADLPKPFYTLQPDTLLTSRFSAQSLNMANAIGITALLTTYTRQCIDSNTHLNINKRLNLIEQLLHINHRINLASLEVSAIAGELDCEEERANQFAAYLKEKEAKTENKLIISSIILGAAGAISAEIISNNSSNANFVSGFIIGVSLAEASLGALMLVNKKQIEFIHKDNALTDIRTHATVSNYFPPAIWYYLNYENTQKGEKSLAKLLVEKWQLFGQVSENIESADHALFELYFGKGGTYNADQLQNRADMLDQTQAYVTLMKQDLKNLAYEIELLKK
ncbi:MAG: hypothetical protein JNK61_01235 [Bacteroidia bacterium]|nr:hypothetical protein [Bacteroidia bacterium]